MLKLIQELTAQKAANAASPRPTISMPSATPIMSAKLRVCPKWGSHTEYKTIRKELANWDSQEAMLSNNHEYHQLVNSLVENKQIKGI